MKGIPNGVVHEKKGNKRPHADERCFFLVFTFGFRIFYVFSERLCHLLKALITICKFPCRILDTWIKACDMCLT